MAESYEYTLESDVHTIGWRAFTGTLSNGMITTIIPGLEDGITYTLRLRVASPWIGTPIELTVTGGRIAYSVHNDGENSYLYEFHTGVPDGGNATRIKRILLPTGYETPRGVAIHGNRAYVTNWNPNEVIVFNHANVDDGDRATLISKFTEISTTNPLNYPIAVFGDRLYVLVNRTTVHVYDRNSTNGQDITLIETITLSGTSDVHPNAGRTGITVTEHSLFTGLAPDIYSFDRGSLTPAADYNFGAGSPSGLAVVNDIFYSVNNPDNDMDVFKRDPDDLDERLLIKTIQLPSGLTEPIGLDIPSARD